MYTCVLLFPKSSLFAVAIFCKPPLCGVLLSSVCSPLLAIGLCYAQFIYNLYKPRNKLLYLQLS